MNDAFPDFDMPELAKAVERMPATQIDLLPYGVIRLDAHGVVTSYSRREAQLSGFDPARAVGMAFFRDVAPCMDGPELRGKIEAAMASGKLDAEFTHIGDFSDVDRELTIRAQSACDGGVWLFIKRFDS